MRSSLLVISTSAHARDREIRNLGRSFMHVLYGYAGRHFAPVGGSLTIDRDPIEESLGIYGKPELLDVEAL
jgi:hypothetical protein